MYRVGYNRKPNADGFREAGFDFRIYTDDHPPAHVHVVRAGEEAVIDLGNENHASVGTRQLWYEQEESAKGFLNRERETDVLSSRMETASWLR